MPGTRLNPRSVFGLAGLFGLVFVLGTAAIGVATYHFTERELAHSVDLRIERERARLIAPANGIAPGAAQVARRIHEFADRRNISSVGYVLLDRDGTRLTGHLEVRGDGQDLHDVEFRQYGGDWGAARAVSTVLRDGGHLTIVGESESGEEMGKIVWRIGGTALVLATILGIGSAVLLSHLIRQRLAASLVTAQAIIAGDYSRRISVDRLGGLFAEHARTFNHMLDRIDALMTNLRQVSSDLAHDLRTPLTRLQGTLSEAGSEDLIDEAQRLALLRSAERETAGVLALFTAILRISEVEAGGRRAQVRRTRLDVLVEDVVDSYAPAFADAKRVLRTGCLHPVTLEADADLINQMLVNLLENVLLHTPAGSETSVLVEIAETGAVLIVRDDGPGIPDTDRKSVFGRFVRLERSRHTPGHGLGLSLVAAIAKFHDASVELEDGRPGLVVRVRFPLSDAWGKANGAEQAAEHSNLAM